MTTLIVVAVILAYVVSWIWTWRTLQARYLEDVIQKNRKNYPSMYGPDSYYSGIRYERGYSDFDRGTARMAASMLGLIWPCFWLAQAVTWAWDRTVSGRVEIVPPSEKARRHTERIKELEREARQQQAEIDQLTRDLNLPNPTITE